MAGFERTTIVGVGLIGGSLGLALRERKLSAEVVGVGYREATLRRAEERGAIDRWTLDLAAGVSGADAVVVCTPVGLVAAKSAAALPAMKPGSILTDVASTKATITSKVEAALREGIAFVPAHPMAGSERRGNESARADLFEGARVILTPTDRTPGAAVAVVRGMWESVGATVETLDIREHDRIVAEISHLPHLVAPAILNAADAASLPYAATGLRDTTRIAASDVGLWLDIFKDNRRNLLAGLRKFGVELAAVREALERSDWSALAEILERARERRRSLERDEGTENRRESKGGSTRRGALLWQVDVAVKPGQLDSAGQAVKSEAAAIGIAGVEDVRSVRVFVIDTPAPREDVDRIASQLLADPVVDQYAIGEPVLDDDAPDLQILQVVRKPGVMDPVETSTLKGIGDMGLAAAAVRTARKYYLYGSLSEADAREIGEKVLANDIIEHLILGGEKIREIPKAARTPFERVEVPLLEADDAEMMRISTEGVLSMNLTEMKTIRDHYRALGRNPTDVELETLAQTWSEHCVHKTFRGIINYNGELIDNLLKQTVMRVTRELDKPWCLSVFEDNSGVIAFDDDWGVAFKVETHNHPSALEPYGGAGTGIGGVIRDPMGTGMGAKPILNTDIFCFGPPDYPSEKLPKGTMHPRRILRGVVAGVRDYGNRMGIPTANGALFFDDRYVGNCLVYCGNIALIPKDGCEKAARPGDLVVVVGGGTGRDGIHGATFSSVELHEETSSSHVQIGDPITEKKMLDVLLVARDRGLYTCITDCGAGGLSSAVGEMGQDIGAEVDLDKVPLKYQGLAYWEIWISEAQERMVIAVPPEHEQELHDLCASENVESTTLGQFTDTGRLVLRYDGVEVCDLEMDFLHNGVPRLERKATWVEPASQEPDLPAKGDYGDDLKRILGSWNVCSKEWVIRQYDHEVQGASVLKPLVGVDNDGPGDACIIAPVFGSTRGLIVSNGMNPKYGLIDPYHMAASAIDEALRNVIAVGGDLDRCALLDNFSWGNPDKPDRLGGLVRAARACYDVAIRYGTPFVSGKDSLNNEYQIDGGTIAVPPSLLISAMAVMPDVTKAVSMDAKAAGNAVYVVGLTKNELGGSHYYDIHGELGRNVPGVDTELGLQVFGALSNATAAGLVRACHDCSEGGLAVAAAEMAFAGGLGMRLDLRQIPCTDDAKGDAALLFSESNSRFVVEVEPDKEEAFEAALAEAPHARIGAVTDDGAFEVVGLNGNVVISEPIADLKESWQAPLRW